MSRTGKDKPGSKPRQRKPKAQQPGGSDDRAQAGKSDPGIADQARTIAPVELAETAPAEPIARETSAGTDIIVAHEATAVNAYSIASAHGSLIGFHTIANAYAGFVMRSFQQTGYFVERLMGVRSLDKAVEVQTEFVNQTCANLATESQNFLGLYGRLARQIFRSWQSLALGPRSG